VAAADADGYVREALEAYAPATVDLDVNVLVDVFHSAMREELVDRNPAELAERPKLPRRNWRILEPAEAGRVAAAFTEFASAGGVPDADRDRAPPPRAASASVEGRRPARGRPAGA